MALTMVLMAVVSMVECALLNMGIAYAIVIEIVIERKTAVQMSQQMAVFVSICIGVYNGKNIPNLISFYNKVLCWTMNTGR